jgi:protein O-mannosyl-transferase
VFFALFDALMTIRSETGTHHQYWAPFSQRLANAIFSYWLYIAKTVWPTNMAPMYPNRGAYLTGLQVGGAAIVLLAITALVIAGRRRRYLPVGWFWFLGTLIPMIQLLQFGLEGMADRFAYQALIGLFIIVCWGLSDLARLRRLSRAWLAGSGATALVALTLVTHQQISYWRAPVIMWQHALRAAPNPWFAEREVGRDLVRRGQNEEALQYFRRALALHPNDAVSNVGIALYEQRHGNPQDAVVRYEHALQDYLLIPQDVATIYTNMGMAYRELGEAAKAQECFEKAAQLQAK